MIVYTGMNTLTKYRKLYVEKYRCRITCDVCLMNNTYNYFIIRVITVWASVAIATILIMTLFFHLNPTGDQSYAHTLRNFTFLLRLAASNVP